MPTDPAALGDELARRQLTMLGAFVTTRLIDPASFDESAAHRREDRARCCPPSPTTAAPVIVLSDEPTADPLRAREAGRIAAASGLDDRQWPAAARGVEQIARAVRDETGLRTVFHHHCADLRRDARRNRSPAGAHRSRAGRPLPRLRPCHLRRRRCRATCSTRHRARVWHVHFKDCEPAVAAQARASRAGTTRRRSATACSASSAAARSTSPACWPICSATGFDGWIVVEQDVLPAMGAPLASATRNREYLRSIGV